MKNKTPLRDSEPVTFVFPARAYRQTSLYPPLGIGYLASSLGKSGIRSRVIDLTFDESMSQLLTLRDRPSSGIYCISFTTPHRNLTAQVVRKIKDLDPEATVIAGGAHPTIMPEDTLEMAGVDIAVLGEGDFILPQIVRAVLSGEYLEKINGIYFKRDGVVVRAPCGEGMKDLDELPFPSIEKFPLEEYFKQKGFRELSLITSRGCPMKCTFCKPTIDKIFGDKLHFRSAGNIVDEIEMITKTHRLDSFFFADDTFTMNQNLVVEICNEMLKRGVNTFWRCASTVKVKKETLRMMRKAGCLSVSFGVESGSPLILRNIEKNITTEDTIRVFEYCKELGIVTWAYLMIGNIGETRETVQMTMDLVKKIRPFGSSVCITTPIPGTKLYEYARSKNTTFSNDDIDFDCLFGDDFKNMLKLPDLTREEVLSLRKELEECAAHSTSRARDILKTAMDYPTIKRILMRMISNPGFMKTIFIFLMRSAVIKSYNILNPKAAVKNKT